MKQVAQALQNNGFDAHVFENKEDACQYLLSTIGKVDSVGIGGCSSAKEMGIDMALRSQGNPVYWHWDCPKDQMDKVRADAIAADHYILSANALTRDGVLMNSDGGGNRLVGSFYGPKHVWFLVGKNKLTGTLQEGFERIRNVATPLNAKRLNVPLNARMHNVTLLLEAPTPGHIIHVLLIKEDLGF